jgi:hypothetical protein
LTRQAVIQIRTQPHYRREAFVLGLARAGYKVCDDVSRPERDDLLVTWNRTETAREWEQRGGTVLVAENGYIGHDANGVQMYALAVRGHNGSGVWSIGGPERWDALGVELKPWRQSGEVIVIRGQRGIGARDMASPHDWHHSASRTIKGLVPSYEQIIQQHPGKPACDPNVTADIVAALARAYAMCIWSSAAGVRALVEGVPVFYAAPHWICEGAAVSGIANIERPRRDDAARLLAMQRLAWAQWAIAEIETGEPFVRLAEVIK